MNLMYLPHLVKLLRPKHYVKNVFVLAPLVFSGRFLETDALANGFLAAILFCLGSSACYIVNDIYDIDSDRKHPVKSKKRPLASGDISIQSAFILLFVLYLLLISAAFLLPYACLVIFAYLILNLSYTTYLKHQPVMDIFSISLGFVLRVYAGAFAISSPVSAWMSTTVLCLALFLAAIKRHQELSTSGTNARPVLQQYSLKLINRYAELSAICSLMFYSMFVLSVRPELKITIPIVLFGLFRYWFIVDIKEAGESPTDALLGDWQLLLTTSVWVVICTWILWPN